MKISWFSAGVSSFIATYLEKDSIDKILYIHIDDQHEDSMRFLHDCEKALNREIEILQSPYKSVGNVLKLGYINSAYGAYCSHMLKKRVRKKWEHGQKDLTYIWGFDCSERNRADRLFDSMPEFDHEFPLIKRNLTKQDCHGMLARLGIARPKMYDLGYRNNNCIGCVKGGMGYWNKIRKDFPDVFKQRAEIEREVGHTCIKGIYLDELETDRGRFEDEIMDECGIMCQINLMEDK